MPLLVAPAHPAGSLSGLEQPRLDVDGQLTLRPWLESDAPAVRAAFDCPDIQRWHVRRMVTDNEARVWIAGWAAHWKIETAASWAVVDCDDRPIGQVGLRTISLAEASTGFSYWVAPEARGTGVAVRAAQTLARWAFATLGMNRVFVDHSTANLASCRVATKAGFRAEGTHRESVLHADGWHDMHMHARLRTDGEWPA